jgi:hypothetical protein
MSQRTQADELVQWIYLFFKKRMEPAALDTFIERGLRARGSKSFNGFMRMLADLHVRDRRPFSSHQVQNFQSKGRQAMQKEVDKLE